ncbi:rhodanese [Formosa sp. Hel3_A1_48]|jgi:rhodanese-related sulfurtransferase|uniref:rhodanese-like domain-containing protein n=1 Tax=Formosa sp. Hel3_A1_48 TaxID=1336795 RepID=UPI00084E1052|nr:rhodanese-like domain-containing protein [Formosa sp. Hel3_A1_48]AOR25790.1 rhodanese [Formosa sp. Hel3_A1_48]MDA9760940.1 rhodanese-like domain-containing protein [Flavobacteriaceae bacterium]MDC0950829.1 rhodanese-like domain-containing protein [Flavobacteriaceae bacterium]
MKNLVQQEWSDELSKSTNGVILDVRTAIEVEDGKIPGATNIDIFKAQEFIDALEKLDKNLPYFVYCKAGSRSAQACAVMHQMGFEYTYNLEGGFSKWSGDVEL